MQRLGTLYRGREGMWTWVLHRVSGVAILFYLFAHVVDQALLNVSPEAYDRVIDTYRNPFVGLLEIGLAVVVIFHALNGLRIILFDFWSQGVARQRQMLWVQTVLFLVLAIPPVIAIGAHVVDQALLNVSPEAYDRVIDTYRNPLVGLLEIGLAVVVIFHALNGLRIILFDFWSQGVARQRQMLWVQTVLFLALAIPPVIAIGAHVVEEL
jgi:succinate dehydrogenase / fumarate reductase cytochrome b subunit